MSQPLDQGQLPPSTGARPVAGDGADVPDTRGIQRLYPTARPTTAPPNVDLSTDFTEHYAAGGYPDVEDAGLAYAAGQRMAARASESRTALTTTPATGDEEISPATAQTTPAARNAALHRRPRKKGEQ